jgi:hypothetical protein
MSEWNPRHRDGWRLEHVAAMAAALLVFLLVYGPELGSFTLSIDEEVAALTSDRGQVWLQQGRWGMALLTALLPDFESLPLLSTVLFGAGLLAATWRALGDLRLRQGGAFAFALVHVGFPLWLHIAEFNTLAAGFGIALAAAAWGAHGLLQPGRTERIVGVLLLAFAISVYQTLLLYAALYLLFALHARWQDEDGARGWHARALEALPLLLGGLAALLAYWLVQKIALACSGLAPVYTGDYLQLERLRAAPRDGVKLALRYAGSLLLGRHPIYLGWGVGVLFLAWAGLWPWRTRLQRARGERDWTLEALVLVGALALLALPALFSLASLPARAYVAWPLLAAWLASRTGPLFPARRGAWLALLLGYFVVVATSIGASMWRSDRLVHDADAALARELGAAVHAAGGDAHPVRFTLVGARSFPFGGQVQRAEVFGDSFFEHDGGNVYRVALLMRLQGVEDVEGVWLAREPNLVEAQRAMPAWPQPGSVRAVDGVVIVKLGEATPPQLAIP